MLNAVAAVSSLPDLLADIGAGVTIIGGIIGLVWGGASKTRQLLEDIALGAAIGGFLGCLISFLVYVFAKIAGGS
jgi:hypothetical protein